jgi:hypothetical protein
VNSKYLLELHRFKIVISVQYALMKVLLQTFVFIAFLSVAVASVAYAFVIDLETNSATQTIINTPYYYVDSNTSEVDSSENKGTHSNFTAQQYGPDLVNDTLTEENMGPRSSILLDVDAFDGAKTGWTRVGIDPYLDNIDYSTSYVNASGNNLALGDFDFEDSGKSTETITNVTLQVYTRQSETDKTLKIFIWNGTNWLSETPLTDPTSWGWINWTVVTILDTWTKIDGARIYFRTGSSTGFYEVDYATLKVDYITQDNYELDVEVQWMNIDFTETNEELCIFGGTMGSENIAVDIWNGATWQNLFPDLTDAWNNVTVNSYLTFSTFTIRFKGSIETGDSTRDSWNIDTAVIHAWT